MTVLIYTINNYLSLKIRVLCRGNFNLTKSESYLLLYTRNIYNERL